MCILFTKLNTRERNKPSSYAYPRFWFDFCLTALQHILGHFRRGQLTYPHCPWASLLGTLPVLSAHYFASNWQLLFLNQRKRENGRRNVFMTKSPRKNVLTWGSNSGPLACQANKLPIELPRPVPIHGNTCTGVQKWLASINWLIMDNVHINRPYF